MKKILLLSASLFSTSIFSATNILHNLVNEPTNLLSMIKSTTEDLHSQTLGFDAISRHLTEQDDSEYGDTVLHKALRAGEIDLFYALVDYIPPVQLKSLKNKEKITLLQLAEHLGYAIPPIRLLFSPKAPLTPPVDMFTEEDVARRMSSDSSRKNSPVTFEQSFAEFKKQQSTLPKNTLKPRVPHHAYLFDESDDTESDSDPLYEDIYENIKDRSGKKKRNSFTKILGTIRKKLGKTSPEEELEDQVEEAPPLPERRSLTRAHSEPDMHTHFLHKNEKSASFPSLLEKIEEEPSSELDQIPGQNKRVDLLEFDL